MGANFQTTESSNDTSASHLARTESYDSYFKKLDQSGLCQYFYSCLLNYRTVFLILHRGQKFPGPQSPNCVGGYPDLANHLQDCLLEFELFTSKISPTEEA